MIFTNHPCLFALAVAALASVTQASIWSIDLVPLVVVDEFFSHLNYVHYQENLGPGHFLTYIGENPEFILYDDITHKIYTTHDDPYLYLNMSIDGNSLALIPGEGLSASFNENHILILGTLETFYACPTENDERLAVYASSFADDCVTMAISLAASSSVPSPTSNHTSIRPTSNYTTTHFPSPTPRPNNRSNASTTSAPISHLRGGGVQGSLSHGVIVAGLAAFVLMLV